MTSKAKKDCKGRQIDGFAFGPAHLVLQNNIFNLNHRQYRRI